MSIAQNFPSIKPTLMLSFADTKQLDPRITFTRASTATVYDGKTFAKAEENLLLQSEDFTNTTYWATNGASVSFTANTSIAPNGATTADTMTAAAGTGNRYGSGTAFYPITSGLVYTASLFVKAGTDTVVQLILPTAQFGSTAFANFDVSGGVLGTVGATATAAISNAGNGWYRCSVTATATGSSTASIGFGFVFVANNTSAARLPSITAAGTETLLIWGAQLEQRSSVTAYTATTTQPITNYIPVLMTAANGVARFDSNPVTGESLGLLIEEQRTNLLLRSEEFDNAYWTKTNASVTADQTVAPDGLTTADTFAANATVTTSARDFRVNVTTTVNAAYTFSIYAKPVSGNFLSLAIRNQAAAVNQVSVEFNISTGAISVAANNNGNATGASASITAVGNGWYRCSISGTPDTSGTQVTVIAIGRTTSNNNAVTENTQLCYVWGAQLEAGSGPATSYIPTAAAQVTRSADSASMTGTNFSSWYRPDEGTFVSNFGATLTGTTRRIYSANADGFSNSISFSLSATNTASAQVWSSASLQANITNTVSANISNTIHAFAYKVNDVAATANNAAVTTDTSATLPAVNQLGIGSEASAAFLNGHIRKIAFYPARLTNAQLVSLTS